MATTIVDTVRQTMIYGFDREYVKAGKSPVDLISVAPQYGYAAGGFVEQKPSLALGDDTVSCDRNKGTYATAWHIEAFGQPHTRYIYRTLRFCADGTAYWLRQTPMSGPALSITDDRNTDYVAYIPSDYYPHWMGPDPVRGALLLVEAMKAMQPRAEDPTACGANMCCRP